MDRRIPGLTLDAKWLQRNDIAVYVGDPGRPSTTRCPVRRTGSARPARGCR
ncbi:hypothetical protein V1227_10850 [Lentzea sp. DG1S-22]|uniref:hypothetical protein n=1 Tax=Lentzea sp. DG1S-22 TaxID=3108822 RepID=UPI002E78948C|nr:hypothetical protein [Lentzea sp. DG1S-22]WVH83218.1 hypothetical protein V1227_10850 [Lentzea sp. DG1S-22]